MHEPLPPLPLTPDQVLAGEPIPVLDHGYLRYVAHLGDDLTPLEAARMSTGNATGTDPAKDDATRDYLWRHAHATPFEMAVLQIEVQVPIFVAREWHRHRTQCLAGTTELCFDLPGAAKRGARAQSYRVPLADLWRRWSQGTTHPITKHKPLALERVDQNASYSIPELALLVGRRKETLRNLIRAGHLEATRQPTTAPNQPSLFVRGQAWHDYAQRSHTAVVPMQERIRAMKLRMANEDTGEIQHTTITDIWQSGVKPLFRVTLDNGYQLTASRDHRFLTEQGWQTLASATGLSLAENGQVSWRADGPRFATNGTPSYQDASWLSDCKARGMKIEEMAELAGCSYHTIRKWLRVHGLQEQNSFAPGHEPWNLGRSYRTGAQLTAAHRQAIVEARSGARSNFWKGGVTGARATIGRWTREQAAALHARSDHRCAVCQQRGGQLHAHHVDPVWHNPARARDLANLITLCHVCHGRLHHHNLELAFLHLVETGSNLQTLFDQHPSPEPAPEGRRLPPGTVRLLLSFQAVKSIEFMGEAMTYDVEVSGPFHNFVADGFVVHNSYNEMSGRYTKLPDLTYVPAPERVQGQDVHNKQGSGAALAPEVLAAYRDGIMADQAQVRAHYQEYLEAGVAKELARINLPLAQYTRFRAQANLRNWLHFLNLRLAPNAQFEIRAYAQVLAQVVAQLWPATWAVFEEHTFRGAQLSRSELSVLRAALAEAPGFLEAARAQLGASRSRELMAKLGLEALP